MILVELTNDLIPSTIKKYVILIDVLVKHIVHCHHWILCLSCLFIFLLYDLHWAFKPNFSVSCLT